MAKTKRPEQKVMYDIAGLFFILLLLKEMAKVWAPAWKEGIFYLTLGTIGCMITIAAMLIYLYIWMDGTARKLRELFCYYNLQGMDGYPKYLGKSRAQYLWGYGMRIGKPEKAKEGTEDTVTGPVGDSNTVAEFYQNNREITRYRFTLPGGLKVSEVGGKLEGMVQHLGREMMLVYEDGKLYIVVGDRTNRNFAQSLK